MKKEAIDIENVTEMSVLQKEKYSTILLKFKKLGSYNIEKNMNQTEAWSVSIGDKFLCPIILKDDKWYIVFEAKWYEEGAHVTIMFHPTDNISDQFNFISKELNSYEAISAWKGTKKIVHFIVDTIDFCKTFDVQIKKQKLYNYLERNYNELFIGATKGWLMFKNKSGLYLDPDNIYEIINDSYLVDDQCFVFDTNTELIYDYKWPGMINNDFREVK